MAAEVEFKHDLSVENYEYERQSLTSTDNITLNVEETTNSPLSSTIARNITDTANSLLPGAIAQNIPGFSRRPRQLKPTYFCNICFTKYPIDEGFILRNCQHQFCAECIKGFMENKIKNGIINLTCFYPIDDSKLNIYIVTECKDRL